ncbi:MAG: cupredoxin domain-containing protein [Bdellovibrionota bacterium]
MMKGIIGLIGVSISIWVLVSLPGAIEVLASQGPAPRSLLAPEEEAAAQVAEIESQPAHEYLPVDPEARSYFGDPPEPMIGARKSFAARNVAGAEARVKDPKRSPAGLEITSELRPFDLPQKPVKPMQVPFHQLRSMIEKKGVQEIGVIAGDLGFFPKTIFVARDIPVRLFVTGASRSPLCFVMDSFAVRKQVRTQSVEEITFVPSQPGSYRFHCPINGMEGTLVVREAESMASRQVAGD